MSANRDQSEVSDLDLPELWRGAFLGLRKVPARGLCGIQRFAFTCGLLVDLKFDGTFYDYSARYCYESFAEALQGLVLWDGKDDPPGEWIKEKVSERFGPGSRDMVQIEQRMK